MRLKSMLAGAVVVVSAVAMSGCGTATNLSSTGATLTKASFASALTKSVTASKSVHMTGEMTTHGQQIRLSADMAMSRVDKSESAVQRLRSAEMAMTMSLPGGKSVEMRLIRGVMYLNAGQLGLSTSKPWVKLDLTDPSNPVGQLMQRMAQSTDPAQMAQAFRKMTKLTNLGQATVDGVSTTHYRATIDTTQMTSTLGLPASQLSQLPKTLTEDVWVDASSHPVKMAMNMRQLAMTMHFSRWGEPVHITAPPASQVAELPFGH
jgi:hypothetical protein